MRCPTLIELPPPPPGKTGWPWTEESSYIPDKIPNSSKWPLISIVTPNYNYGHFLEGTIRSVLLQGYPNLEYIIIDGGSTDCSVEIIKKYEPWLHYWVSENDNGQSNAINKGLSVATGLIFNWLNSDDQLVKGALANVALAWQEHEPDIYAGSGTVIDCRGNEIVLHEWEPKPWKDILDFLPENCWGRPLLTQPSAFLRRSIFNEIGCIREDLEYVMDWDLYARISLHFNDSLKFIATNDTLSIAYMHQVSKTGKDWMPIEEELYSVLEDFCPKLKGHQKQIFARTVATRKCQKEITDILALHSSKAIILKLLVLALLTPNVLSYRFFWGAFRLTVKR